MNSYLEPCSDPVDRLLELYREWRATCWDVRTTYDHFCTVDAHDRSLAYAAYAAALDREETVARAYADQVDRVSLLLEGDSSTTAATANS